MAQGKRGTGGTLYRLKANPEIARLAGDLVSPMSRGQRENLDRQDVLRRMLYAGADALSNCPECKTGLPCARHSEHAILVRLSLADLDGLLAIKAKVDAGAAEHQALVDLYAVLYEKHRGAKPAFTGRDFRAFKELRTSLGFEAAKRAIEGAFSTERSARYATIVRIAADPSAFVGGPKASRSSSSTLQREEYPEG